MKGFLLEQTMTQRYTLNKNKYIQLIHIAKSKLGLDDDVYRDILTSETGKNSSKDMTTTELVRVLNRLKSNGFTVQSQTKEMLSTPQNNLILHLWSTLYRNGIVKNPSETALFAFIQRHFKNLKSLNELTNYQASHIIEQLKKWCSREGIPY